MTQSQDPAIASALPVSEIPTNWTFENVAVAKGFQRHVRTQLPWYDLATGMVAHIARHYIPDNGVVYDIGASLGNIGNNLRGTLEARHATFVPIESSAEMVKLYGGPGEVVHADAQTYDFQQYDCAIIFLVLMFLPPSTRLTWLSNLLQRMRPGGCLIIFEKFAPNGLDANVATALRRLTLAGKVATGTAAEEILAKELSLSGVQRPLDHRQIESLSPNPQRVFQFGEFAGYVFTRPEQIL